MKNDGVIFEAAGRSWTLRFDARAFCEIEDATGVGMNELFEQIKVKGSMKLICATLTGGLRGSCPDINGDTTFELVDTIGIVKAAEYLGNALQAAFGPVQAKAGAENPRTPKAGSGTHS